MTDHRHDRAGWLYCCVWLSASCANFEPPKPPALEAPTEVSADAGLDKPPPLPPSMESEAPVGSPRFTHGQVGDEYMFIPDPVDHAVTVLKLQDGSAREVRAGIRPDFLSVAPGRDLAIVLDVVGSNAYVIRVDASGITRTELRSITLGNAIAFSPDAQHAIIYFDPEAQLAGGEPPDHDYVTLVDLTGEPVATDVELDFVPDEVVLSSTPPRAYVRSGTSITRIDLDATAALTEIDTGARSATLLLYPQSSIALSFQAGRDSITIIDLEANHRDTIWLTQLATPGQQGSATDAAMPTDVTLAHAVLSDDGKHILVALAEQDELLELQWPEIVDDQTALTRYDLAMTGPQQLLPGPGGTLGILGGNPEGPEPQMITLWSRDNPDAMRRYRLPAPAIGAQLIGDGTAAVIQHDSGYTVASRAAAGSFYREADAPVTEFLTAGDELFAIAPEDDDGDDIPETLDAAVPALSNTDGRASIDRVPLGNLEARRLPLDSPPRRLGVSPGDEYLVIDMAHPTGRVTIVDLGADTRRTFTGFHINDRVKE